MYFFRYCFFFVISVISSHFTAAVAVALCHTKGLDCLKNLQSTVITNNVVKAKFVSGLRELVGLELTAHCFSKQCCALVVLLEPLDLLLTPWQPVGYLGVLTHVVTRSLETFKTNVRGCSFMMRPVTRMQLWQTFVLELLTKNPLHYWMFIGL